MGRRKRLRNWGLSVGSLETGTHNAITDVEGVLVGHCTVRPDRDDIRTGVTAVLPNEDVYWNRVLGGGFVLNGAGEVSGLNQVLEWGLIETPILLTNTLSVGTVTDSCVHWLVERHPEIGLSADVPIPLVGECDDSWLNDIAGRHVHLQHVEEALDGAKSGPVREGSVGGGTGMVAFDFKAGIGTSSRIVEIRERSFTLGVLVQANLGRMPDLRLDGRRIGPDLDDIFGDLAVRRQNYGSAIVVFATDAPLLAKQLSRVAKRCALGLGLTGSHAAHHSGEIAVGFSTANISHRTKSGLTETLTFLRDEHVEPLYRAAIEATEEAVLNSLCVAAEVTGFHGHTAPAFPIERFVDK